jgi:hypothetical protein
VALNAPGGLNYVLYSLSSSYASQSISSSYALSSSYSSNSPTVLTFVTYSISSSYASSSLSSSFTISSSYAAISSSYAITTSFSPIGIQGAKAWGMFTGSYLSPSAISLQRMGISSVNYNIQSMSFSGSIKSAGGDGISTVYDYMVYFTNPLVDTNYNVIGYISDNHGTPGTEVNYIAIVGLDIKDPQFKTINSCKVSAVFGYFPPTIGTNPATGALIII